jgi:hypothetical protein
MEITFGKLTASGIHMRQAGIYVSGLGMQGRVSQVSLAPVILTMQRGLLQTIASSLLLLSIMSLKT